MNIEHALGFLNTPSLWEGSLCDITQFEFPQLHLVNFNSKPIPDNLRLGHQVEYLFHQLIEYSNVYEILIFNQPIKNENRTIGEIDFILRNKKNNSLTHVELTYKFYIIDPTIPETINQLIGPNKKDSFSDKIQKIKNKQFKLLQTTEATKLLKVNNIDFNKITSTACFKSQLFIPYQNSKINLKAFNEDCIIGYWLKLSEFESDNFTDKLFHLPEKQAWIIKPHNKVKWKSFTEIKVEILQKHSRQNSPMVWMKTTENRYDKFFIVWW